MPNQMPNRVPLILWVVVVCAHGCDPPTIPMTPSDDTGGTGTPTTDGSPDASGSSTTDSTTDSTTQAVDSTGIAASSDGTTDRTTVDTNDGESSGSSTSMADASTDESTTSGTESDTLSPPDTDGPSIVCDLYAQDCPEDQKCMAWADDGGNVFNATHCTPVAPVGGQPGDVCLAPEGPVAGLDDCDLGFVCWDVDPATNVGVCQALCTGRPSSPVCESPDTECTVQPGDILALCLEL